MTAVGRIMRQMSLQRASVLAKESVDLCRAGDLEKASRKLREAAALGHDNVDVQDAFLELHSGSATSPLTDLCRRYAQYHDPRAGEDAIDYLRSPNVASLNPVALECLQMLLENNTITLSAAQDTIIAQLARYSIEVRRYFASELTSSTTEFFDNIYARGDKAANCLRTVVLDPTLWTDEETRLRVEDDLFQLFLAKLMESGHDHDGRALKGIALLLLADTERLHYFIDEDAAEALLTSLDFRLPSDVRGQAALVYSKFLEVSEAVAQTYFAAFVTKHVSRQKGEDLILAFAAAAGLFPIVPAIVAQLFLTEGFLASIMPVLSRNFTSTLVHDSFLALLNAACIDGACRLLISQNCGAWLSHLVSNGAGKQPAMSATILAKLRVSGMKGTDMRAPNRAEEDVSDLVNLFRTTLTTEEKSTVSDSIEGLAYASLKPEVKEQLASDQSFAKSLLQALESNPTQPEIVIGGLSVIQNITHYTPTLSEEQKKMTQLKAYANASRPVEPNPLENDEHVSARCSKIVEAGAVPTLVKIGKNSSSSTAHLTDQILLSLAKNSKDRGKIAQQGAVKLLISHALKTNEKPTEGLERLTRVKSTTPVTHDAAHALARILISLNPAHVFPASSTPHITDAVAALVVILRAPSSEGPVLASDGPRDLLPIFETLLALTNLASSPDESAANAIIRSTWDEIEDLLLGSNDMLRRAATELICNLVAHPAGIGKFADGSRRAGERLRLLVAMTDVEDMKTRSAAGGALAMITEYEPIVKSLLETDDKGKRTFEIILDMVTEGDAGLAHRGLAILANFVSTEGQLGLQSQDVLNDLEGAETIKTALRDLRDPAILQIGVDVLKKLQN